MALAKLQIGKKGLTKEFLETLKRFFIKADSIRISILKSGTRDKEKAKEWANEILSFLGKNYTAKIIGYTLIIRKWRVGKDMRKV